MELNLSLFLKTGIISFMMLFLCTIPLWVQSIKKVSHYLFLTGTGALIGICFIDLLPDVYEAGGSKSLIWVGLIWAIYSIFHYVHYRKKHVVTGHEECHGHGHTDEHHHVLLHADEMGIGIFLGSMMLHCFASGFLLAISARYSEEFSRTVFFALLTHKAYESLIVSSLILEKVKQMHHALLAVFLYAVSLPFGVLVAGVESELITPNIATAATCIALGTLLGCMIFDFMLPSFQHIKKYPRHLVWIIAGFVLTEIIMRYTHILL